MSIGGGVDGAIHRAAGKQLFEETQKLGGLGGCAPGQVKLTYAYALPAKFVIRTVGPIWYGSHQDEARILEHCHEQSLKLANAQNCQSIAFPAISSGVIWLSC